MFCTVNSKKKKDILCLKICALVINLCLNGWFSVAYFWKSYINIAGCTAGSTPDPPKSKKYWEINCQLFLFVSPMDNIIISDQRLKSFPNPSGRPSLVKVTRVWTGATMGRYLNILRQAPVKEHFELCRRVCRDFADMVFVLWFAGSKRADCTVAQRRDKWAF